MARSIACGIRRNPAPDARVVGPMPYEKRPYAGTGLAILALGAASAFAATALALHRPALREAVHLDLANAAFAGLGWLTLALVGNAFWIFAVERPSFAPRWWIATGVFVAVLVGIGARASWPLPLVIAALGGFLVSAAGVISLFELPFGLAMMFADARRYPNAESFRLVRRRP